MDAYNNRILVYAPDAITPFRVIGQVNFTSGGLQNRGASKPAANSLSTPTFVRVDQNNGLYVTDFDNARVLYFPPGNDTATRVYGQNGDFTTSNERGGAGGLGRPYDVALERDGSGLFIADAFNHRVLYYPGTATLPTRVIGQPDFDTYTVGSGATGFHTPTGMALDSVGGLWVTSLYQNRVLYFPAGSNVATRVLGQPDMDTISYPAWFSGDATTATEFSGPFGVSVDRADDVYVADVFNSRVLYFERGASEATRVWGQGGNFTTTMPNFNGEGVLDNEIVTAVRGESPNPTADSLNTPYFGPAFDSKNRMYIADTYNCRVLRFDLL